MAKLQGDINPAEAFKKAQEAEAVEDLDAAAKFYEVVIRSEHLEEQPFSRLMIVYRKLRRYKEELRVIDRGIKAFENYYKLRTKKRSGGKKLSDLSENFLKSAGLKDKKGQATYHPEPIAKWMKRREIVQKKIQAAKK